ncbi:MAG: hypothetical protein ACUVRN_10285 [Candidatus Caldatribacteriaceae bacterium]
MKTLRVFQYPSCVVFNLLLLLSVIAINITIVEKRGKGDERMTYFNFWYELRESLDFCFQNPVVVLPALPSAFFVALANHFVWRRSLSWVTAFFQWGISVVLVIFGILLGFIALSFIVSMTWDAERRNKVYWNQAWYVFSSRFPEILVASLIVGFLVSFFSIFFVFPGLIFGFLLMFVLPSIIVEREDPFSAIRRSFQLSLENLGECFTFLVVVLFFGVVGYLLFSLFGCVPLVGVILNTIVGGFLIAYIAVFLTRFYLNLTRF